MASRSVCRSRGHVARRNEATAGTAFLSHPRVTRCLRHHRRWTAQGTYSSATSSAIRRGPQAFGRCHSSAARSRAGTSKGRWQAFGRHEWPVDQEILEEHDPDEGKESWVSVFRRDTPREIRQFRAVLRYPLGAMINLMRSGAYRAFGDPGKATGATARKILSSVWSHLDFVFDRSMAMCCK